MEKVKKGLRFFATVLFLILASFGIGIGNILNNNQATYLDNEIRIERVDKKKDEEDDQPDIEG
ncbi:MAG TPA: hypothetical protein VEW65_14655 [Chryseolinea sp.]|nr:hypothetical protein [Chryseolinea sp.]